MLIRLPIREANLERLPGERFSWNECLSGEFNAEFSSERVV